RRLAQFDCKTGGSPGYWGSSTHLKMCRPRTRRRPTLCRFVPDDEQPLLLQPEFARDTRRVWDGIVGACRKGRRGRGLQPRRDGGAIEGGLQPGGVSREFEWQGRVQAVAAGRGSRGGL